MDPRLKYLPDEKAFKRQAVEIKKATGEKHAQCLHELAKHFGFLDYGHLRRTVKQARYWDERSKG